jgi:protein involved in polysaccharide export with SLBB domain
MKSTIRTVNFFRTCLLVALTSLAIDHSVFAQLEEPFSRTEPQPVGIAAKSVPTATPIPAPTVMRAEAVPPSSSPFFQPAARPAVAVTQTAQATDSEYVLKPKDTIEMSVFREPDLTTQTTISSDGTVQLPLVNDVRVGGLTVRQARDLIRNRYNADYLVEPQVSVSVLKFADRKFTILGQVNSPGTYSMTGDDGINLMEAVGMAGGFTRIADRKSVKVSRTAGGKSQTFKLNSKKMAESSGEAFPILPGDVITVGESWY